VDTSLAPFAAMSGTENARGGREAVLANTAGRVHFRHERGALEGWRADPSPRQAVASAIKDHGGND
jgi:hypothetical protein